MQGIYHIFTFFIFTVFKVSSAAGYVWPEIISRAPGSKEGGVSNQVLDEGKGPELDIQGGRHPMLEFSMSQRGEGDYIPNTLVLGGPLHLKQVYLIFLYLLLLVY
jgi:hypothetical protein